MKEFDAFIFAYFYHEAKFLEKNLIKNVQSKRPQKAYQNIIKQQQNIQTDIDYYRNIKQKLDKKTALELDRVFLYIRKICDQSKAYFMYLLLNISPMESLKVDSLDKEVNMASISDCKKILQQFQNSLFNELSFTLINNESHIFKNLCFLEKKLDIKIISENIKKQSYQKIYGPEGLKRYESEYQKRTHKDIQNIKQSLVQAKIALINFLEKQSTEKISKETLFI